MDSKTFKVTISTVSRFHSFDLARELETRGHLAAIFTGYPRFILRDTGVSPQLIRTFPWLQAPYMVLLRMPRVPSLLTREWAWWAVETLDRHVARQIPECAVVSALSSAGLHTGRSAKRRGIAYVCDRGSTHIRYQERIVAEEYARVGLTWRGIDPRVIDKELAEYELADAITIPSSFVAESFRDEGLPPEKLNIVPYGVDLNVFRTSAPAAPMENFRILFAGQLSVRKGLHDLLSAFARADLPNATLALAGPTTEDTEYLLARYPVQRLQRLGSLPRRELALEMARAHVMVLPSIEEGLARVIPEALSCGCPVIITKNTGADEYVKDLREGFIIPIRDPDTIADRLTRLYENPELQKTMATAARARVESLGGWRDYGQASLAVFARLALHR